MGGKAKMDGWQRERGNEEEKKVFFFVFHRLYSVIKISQIFQHSIKYDQQITVTILPLHMAL